MSGYRAPDKDYLETGAVEPIRHHGADTSELSTDEATGDFRMIDPHSGVKRGLKTRHLSMMALAGIIGPGLLVGSGGALSSGGPAALLIGFGTIGILAFSIMQSLGELTTLYPSGGAFTGLADRFVDKAFGVAVGWNYFIICKQPCRDVALIFNSGWRNSTNSTENSWERARLRLRYDPSCLLVELGLI